MNDKRPNNNQPFIMIGFDKKTIAKLKDEYNEGRSSWLAYRDRRDPELADQRNKTLRMRVGRTFASHLDLMEGDDDAA